VTIFTSRYPGVDIPNVSLGEFVIEPVARRGAHPTVVDGVAGTVTTADELVARVHDGAGLLSGLEVGLGQVVAVMAPNHSGFVSAFHATLATGAAVTPLNPLLTAEEIAKQLRDSDATLFLADSSLLDKARQAASLAGVSRVDPLDSDWPGTAVRCRDFAWPQLDPATTLAALPYSSGTTGTAKGVMLTHRNLVANLAQFTPMWPYREDDVVCAALPFFHSYGMTVILNLSLLHGPTIVTLPRFSPLAYLETIERYRLTRLHLAPPMILQLVNFENADRFDTSSVRWAVSGAAPLDAELADRFEARFGVRVTQGYGMTEASPGTHLTPDCEPDLPIGSVGRLMPMTEARIVPIGWSPTPDEPEPGPAEEGEIWVRGPQVMAGYLGNPEATAAALTADGWLRTGDVARVDDGVFFVIDRVKELIKYKGYQVAPAELEALLLTHPDILDAAVIGVFDEAAGETPKAFVVAARPVDAAGLMEWVGERVAPYKRVRAVQFVDAIPKSPSGKILRRVLAEEERNRSARPDPP
jgi:acyl-CoA synthetase (AMP-forming)/AMP-acid ligase II